MLRTNLSTRPFYNLRAVKVTLGALGLVLVLITLVNAVQLVRLTTTEQRLGARASEAESEAQRLRAEAGRIRSQINAKELSDVAAAAQEANSIIDLRAFSWSDLFTRIETTLPESVRLTAFRPQEDEDGRFRVNLSVQARRVQDLDLFLDALEKSGVFQDVLAAQEQATSDGLIDATVEGFYVQPNPQTAVAGPPATETAQGAPGE